MSLRSRLVDVPSSFGARARARRWELLVRLFPDLSTYRVLDLGGTTASWLRAPVVPKSVTVLNLYAAELTVGHEQEPLPAWVDLVAGDACDPPAAVTGSDYDLVISNSLIEHVGGAMPRRRLAAVVREGAPRYWVQTRTATPGRAALPLPRLPVPPGYRPGEDRAELATGPHPGH